MARNSTPILKCVALALAFTGSVMLACGDLGEALEREECFSDADCGPLLCAAPNPAGLNPTGLGWCSSGSSCIDGEQPFCPCVIDPATSMPACTSPSQTNRSVTYTKPCWDSMDMEACLCLPQGLATPAGMVCDDT